MQGNKVLEKGKRGRKLVCSLKSSRRRRQMTELPRMNSAAWGRVCEIGRGKLRRRRRATYRHKEEAKGARNRRGLIAGVRCVRQSRAESARIEPGRGKEIKEAKWDFNSLNEFSIEFPITPVFIAIRLEELNGLAKEKNRYSHRCNVSF